MSENFDSWLEHHGIKGMKWGVRRTDAQLGRRPGLLERVRVSKAEAEKRKEGNSLHSLKKRKLSELSDEELKKIVNRIDMEMRYKDYLKSIHPDKKAKAKAFVGEILKSGAKTMADAAFKAWAKKVFENAAAANAGKTSGKAKKSTSSP